LGAVTNRIIFERRKLICHQSKSVIPRKNFDTVSIQKTNQACKKPQITVFDGRTHPLIIPEAHEALSKRMLKSFSIPGPSFPSNEPPNGTAAPAPSPTESTVMRQWRRGQRDGLIDIFHETSLPAKPGLLSTALLPSIELESDDDFDAFEPTKEEIETDSHMRGQRSGAPSPTDSLEKASVERRRGS
jgi:hypothetical protein